ncbi:MAG: hypothetical protein OXN94_04465 [Chloroflexota bacterium]|nr:hypothetical protein [Chloroflexota bacterium]MDE2857086.1 hypothetical protein [Chloroflexota bacterium]MDE2949620.1 hypothetical protein [Chloroflexota bacterium]
MTPSTELIITLITVIGSVIAGVVMLHRWLRHDIERWYDHLRQDIKELGDKLESAANERHKLDKRIQSLETEHLHREKDK